MDMPEFEGLNLDLRKEITNIALNTEFNINKLLTIYLNIDAEYTKTLSNKSSSLSFKNKIDLLFDLEIINNEEHGELLLLMEFRNQFLHNLECNSFVKAVEFLGADRKNRLLRHNQLDFETDEEFRLNAAYRSLFVKCMDIVLEKYESKRNHYMERSKMVLDLINYCTFINDSLYDIFTKAFNEFMPESVEKSINTQEILSRVPIFEFIFNSITEMHDSPQYRDLLEKFSSGFSKDRIDKFFK